MGYRYARCPYCGQSDGNDDKIISSAIVNASYNGRDLTVMEKRRCDICRKVYPVEMHYELKYENIADE